LDPADADWRKDPWISHDEGRARVFKVTGDKEGWIELPVVATQRLLAWHDKAQPGDTIKGVTTDIVRNRAYDYTYEGGCWLSQRNPDVPASPPRFSCTRTTSPVTAFPTCPGIHRSSSSPPPPAAPPLR
jgi:hypothetical protein